MADQHETDSICRGADEILFRRLDAPAASWTKPGGRWAVEYWCAEMAYPVAQAWVFTGGYEPYVDWLYVMEDHRRSGIGTTLLDAIRARWPDVVFDAFTDSGDQFLAAHEEHAPNTGTRLCDD